MDLKDIKTADLVAELLERKDLVRPDGALDQLVWKLRVVLGVIICVDCIAIRKNGKGQKEVVAELRNTGPYAGKYCVIGGIVRKGESIEEAVHRHWKVDLGCDITMVTPWNKPRSVHQHCPPNTMGEMKKDFYPEPTKYSIGLAYAVEVTNETGILGSTVYGGQEASHYTWFTKETLPPPEKFAYGFYALYKEILNEE